MKSAFVRAKNFITLILTFKRAVILTGAIFACIRFAIQSPAIHDKAFFGIVALFAGFMLLATVGKGRSKQYANVVVLSVATPLLVSMAMIGLWGLATEKTDEMRQGALVGAFVFGTLSLLSSLSLWGAIKNLRAIKAVELHPAADKSSVAGPEEKSKLAQPEDSEHLFGHSAVQRE